MNSKINPKSRSVKLSASLQHHRKILLLWTFFFMTEAVKNSAVDFLGFGEAAVKNLVDVLHYELPLGPFYGHI